MCSPDPATIAAIGSLLGGASSAVSAAKNKPKSVQEAKAPDTGITEDEKRSRLLAQLAAGASRNNPSGGLAGNVNTGVVALGT